MLSSQLVLNLNRNAQQMNNTQTQLATGRKINKPSDDPVGITYSLRYRAELSSNEQYQKNVDSTISWLEFNDTVMDQTGSVIGRLRELTVQAATGTNPQEALDSINEEVKQLKAQLVDISNSKLNGKYIFNGETYDQKPYDFPASADGSFDTTNAAAVITDPGKINFIVGESIQMPINVTGNEFLETLQKQTIYLLSLIRLAKLLQTETWVNCLISLMRLTVVQIKFWLFVLRLGLKRTGLISCKED